MFESELSRGLAVGAAVGGLFAGVAVVSEVVLDDQELADIQNCNAQFEGNDISIDLEAGEVRVTVDEAQGPVVDTPPDAPIDSGGGWYSSTPSGTLHSLDEKWADCVDAIQAEFDGDDEERILTDYENATYTHVYALNDEERQQASSAEIIETNNAEFIRAFYLPSGLGINVYQVGGQASNLEVDEVGFKHIFDQMFWNFSVLPDDQKTAGMQEFLDRLDAGELRGAVINVLLAGEEDMVMVYNEDQDTYNYIPRDQCMDGQNCYSRVFSNSDPNSATNPTAYVAIGRPSSEYWQGTGEVVVGNGSFRISGPDDIAEFDMELALIGAANALGNALLDDSDRQPDNEVEKRDNLVNTLGLQLYTSLWDLRQVDQSQRAIGYVNS